MKNIKRLYRLLDLSVFHFDGTLDYGRITTGITLLANLLDGHDEIDWGIGEFDNVSLDEFIVGAYWHYADYNNGQWSPEYAALCALGKIFKPGMSSADENSSVYLTLADMADEYKTY